MQDFADAFRLAFALLTRFDPDLVEIVVLSLEVTLSAVLLACAIGFPAGAALAAAKFPGRGVVIVILNTMMSLPPVVIGLLVYMLVSNAGPLGFMQLLYTAGAMILAQTILVTPLVAALGRQVLANFHDEYDETFRSMAVPWRKQVAVLLWDARYSLLTVALAGFGRAIAEVGAVIIVGGNISHVTRVMTTAIALETSRGDLALALALGIVLLVVAVTINAGVMVLRASAQRLAYV
jgi:tungstate transport system permease protein